ncbi:MAG: 3-isopropylmalate dehydratase small subunit [Pseudomonadota bacterium]
MKSFDGAVLFLDRADINTDEIIPAKYLNENAKEDLKPFLLEDLSLEEFDPALDCPGKRVIVSRENFGCGSSREHAAWVFEVNDINLVIGISFARIFRQNMFNCGMMAVALPPEDIDLIFRRFGGCATHVTTDMHAGQFTFKTDGDTLTVPFTIGDFDRILVESGGWVNYADANY